MPIVPERVWTREAFEALPEDGRRYQVLDGELFVMPAPSFEHQLVASELIARLLVHAKRHRLGIVVHDINLDLGPGRYQIPDVVFVQRELLARFTGPRTVWVDAAPKLIAEVVSPSSGGYDRIRKRRAYEAWGIGEYWIVDPEARWVEVYRFASSAPGADPEIVTDVLRWSPGRGAPDLEIDLPELFGPLPDLTGGRKLMGPDDPEE